jgi:hypothetical protein
VRVPQHGDAVLGADPIEFAAELIVIRAPPGVAALGDLRAPHGLSIAVDRRTVESHVGTKARGCLSGVQTGVVGRPIQVDYVAGVRGLQDRRSAISEGTYVSICGIDSSSGCEPLWKMNGGGGACVMGCLRDR